ncbi:MAG: hypothetical protein DRO04_01365 [Candidatus Iainarchaeum archaeon]|uniref:Uncharacterized protein n=1 Tax=Candidatus Iainarchaeum sp. TaxID=3101447 RepID=A0A497JHL7_9ARCH|nr:MAG: hypothetical protein DRO04_01365 [Candidatus Diapherotrites archaeon]
MDGQQNTALNKKIKLEEEIQGWVEGVDYLTVPRLTVIRVEPEPSISSILKCILTVAEWKDGGNM